jgi:hypothetical protein
VGTAERISAITPVVGSGSLRERNSSTPLFRIRGEPEASTSESRSAPRCNPPDARTIMKRHDENTRGSGRMTKNLVSVAKKCVEQSIRFQPDRPCLVARSGNLESVDAPLRMVLDKVIVKDWRVDLHDNIPLPKPTPPPEQKVSTKFDLRSTCRRIWRGANYAGQRSQTAGIGRR